MTNATEALIDVLLIAARQWGNHPREMIVPVEQFWWLVAEGAMAGAKAERRPGAGLHAVSMPDGSLVEVELVESLKLAGPLGWVVVRPEGNGRSATLTDAELRAECERRHLSVKRDEQLIEGIDTKLRARAEDYKRECERLKECLAGADHDRDEWKRRAEAAEAIIAEQSRIEPCRHGTPQTDPCARCKGEFEASQTPEASKRKVTGLEAWLPSQRGELLQFGTDRRDPRTYERGPGIDGPSAITKPPKPEPLAWLDEDLLCEDA